MSMVIIQFLEPVDNDFIGPFETERSATLWLEVNERSEENIIHSLTDPITETYKLWRN